MDWVKIAPPLAAGSAIIVACLAAIFTYINFELQKTRKRRDLYRLLKAEITNLERHCRISSSDIPLAEFSNLSYLRMARFRDGSMLLFDTKEAYLLNENICQDVMTLFLMSRNNDICIDETVIAIRSSQLDADEMKSRIGMVRSRLSGTAILARRVLGNLADFAKHPRSYKRPTIDW